MSTQTWTLFGTVLVIFSTCVHSIEGLEGRLFYLSFMNTTDFWGGMREIFVSSSDSGRVKIQYKNPINYTEDIIELNSSNNFQYVKRIIIAYRDWNSPLKNLLNLTIVISSEMDISVQANDAETGTGGGYLALPITEHSVSFFLASYWTRNYNSSFAIASPFNDTSISISYVRGNSGYQLMNLTMQANDVYQEESPTRDYTGVYVASSRPITVYSGHLCANVPVFTEICDYIVEQVPPVAEWGKLFIMASFYGRPWDDGYRIRVVAQTDTNVTYTFQLFDEANNPSNWSIFRRVTLVRGEWDEASLESITATNAVVVMVNCTFDCLVMQYNPSVKVAIPWIDDPGSRLGIPKPGPFMVTVPALNHYPQNVRFSTSRQYSYQSDHECVNGITIIAKTADIIMSKIYLDGIPLTSIGGTTFVINADGYSDYSVIIAPLTSGFHSVTSTDPNVYYAVFVYGYDSPNGLYTAYGYLGGYRYLQRTTGSSTKPSSSSTYDSKWTPYLTEYRSTITGLPIASVPYGWNTACSVTKLGIGLGVSCGVIIFVLVGIVVWLCVENRNRNISIKPAFIGTKNVLHKL